MEFTDALMKVRSSVVSDGINDQSVEHLESQMQKQKFQISDDDRRMEAEQDFYQGIIKQRNEDVNAIADIMQNINSIAKDLAIEVKDGGEKLDKLNE